MQNSPKFTHDCDDCKFLANVVVNGIDYTKNYDLYFCKNCDGGTYIVRYGERGQDYGSIPQNMLKEHHNPLYHMARNLHIITAVPHGP